MYVIYKDCREIVQMNGFYRDNVPRVLRFYDSSHSLFSDDRTSAFFQQE